MIIHMLYRPTTGGAAPVAVAVAADAEPEPAQV